MCEVSGADKKKAFTCTGKGRSYVVPALRGSPPHRTFLSSFN